MPLLAALDTAVLRKLAQEAPAEVHLPGSVLMRQGDHGDRMLLLTQGTARVFKIPDDEFVVVHSSGRWPSHVPPALKQAAQVLHCAACPRRAAPPACSHEVPVATPASAALHYSTSREAVWTAARYEG